MVSSCRHPCCARVATRYPYAIYLLSFPNFHNRSDLFNSINLSPPPARGRYGYDFRFNSNIRVIYLLGRNSKDAFNDVECSIRDNLSPKINSKRSLKKLEKERRRETTHCIFNTTMISRLFIKKKFLDNLNSYLNRADLNKIRI